MNGSDIIIIPEATGKHRDVSVTFINLPCRNVPSKGKKTWIDDDFNSTLTEEVFNKANICAKGKGFFKKNWLCHDCGNPLALGTEGIQLFELPISYKDYPSFTLRIELPTIICTSCSVRNVIPEAQLESDVYDAIIAAYESQGIKP